MDLNPWAIGGMAATCLGTFVLGYLASGSAVTTTDFLVARRAVRARRNATAIAGEYLSAASFLGVAGLMLKDGANALWYPVGFVAGFLGILLFVAAPLRRSGAYTLPDFAEARLGSVPLRNLCTLVVVVICCLYLIPQFQGAGLVLSLILPVPNWVGGALVALLVVVNVLGGGMRSATPLQSLQYWGQLITIAVPAVLLCLAFVLSGPGHDRITTPDAPQFSKDTTVTVRTPVTITVRQPVLVRAAGAVNGVRRNGQLRLSAGKDTVAAGTTLRFPRGAAVPVVENATASNTSWLRLDPDAGDALGSYSLIFALFIGTMGLPHVLVRFYTNPDGRAARRTVLYAMMLLGVFYLFPVILGALSRLYVPQLLTTGESDAAIMKLPGAILHNTEARIVVGVFVAGAFAAFLSACSGLLISLAGVLSTDVLPGRVRDFRLAAVLAALLPFALSVLLPAGDITTSVGISFAMAASTFSPLLLLGIWWRKLTVPGAAAGIVVGGLLVLACIAITVISGYTGNWAPKITTQPALITVPIAFLTVFLVSKSSSKRIPDDVNGIFLRLHAPDPLGLTRDRDVDRFSQTKQRQRDTDPPTLENIRPVGGRHRRP